MSANTKTSLPPQRWLPPCDELPAPRLPDQRPRAVQQSFVDRNPLVWMAEVNGVLVDLRDMPREVQAIAYEKDMIPYSRRTRNRARGASASRRNTTPGRGPDTKVR